MARLTNLRPVLGTLRSQLPNRADAQGHSATAEPWRKWYSLARWRRLRLEVLQRDMYTCRYCRRLEGNTALLVADHVEPHHGDEALFWDPGNIQALCKPCHDSRKQSVERRARVGGDAIAGPKRDSGRGAGSMARPAWFRQVYVPLTIVCGPPGAGKSTFVREHAGPADLTICFDRLAEFKFGKSREGRARIDLAPDQVADVLRMRNELLGDLMRSAAADRWPQAWLILSEPGAEDRMWWSRTLGAKLVVLATPAEECRRRIRADEQAGDVRGAVAARYVTEWWRLYAPAPCDLTISARPEAGL